MVNADAPVCSTCGRRPTFGAAFCPYCGARLETPGAAAHEPAPPREALTGPCAVLLRSDARVQINRVGRILARAAQRPLVDVTRDIRTNPGFLLREVDADAARAVADDLEALDIDVLILAESDLAPLPEVRRMKSVRFADKGLDCEAYRWTDTEELHIDWDDIGLVSCARIEVREVHTTGAPELESNEDDGPLAAALRPPNQLPRLETRVRHEYIIDAVVRRPEMRLRLDENTAGYALVDVHSLTDEGRAYYRAARNILRYGAGTPVNPGLRMLAENTPTEFWSEFTFESKREFDVYNLWLMQLLRFGLPIPEGDG